MLIGVLSYLWRKLLSNKRHSPDWTSWWGFSFNIRSTGFGSSNCCIPRLRLSHLSWLKELVGSRQILHDKPIISLNPPCSCREEKLGIFRRRIWTMVLCLVYASVKQKRQQQKKPHTSCSAPSVNHICTPCLAFMWIFYSAVDVKDSPKSCCSHCCLWDDKTFLTGLQPFTRDPSPGTKPLSMKVACMCLVLNKPSVQSR